MSASKSFMGTGWSFPPTFDNHLAEVKMLHEEEDIRSSLAVLLSTRPGERVMQPTFGCNLDDFLFEPLTTTLQTYISDLIRTAVLYHEPRISLISVDMSESINQEGLVLITLEYTVKTTNSRYNFVYPFYKNENSEIRY